MSGGITPIYPFGNPVDDAVEYSIGNAGAIGTVSGDGVITGLLSVRSPGITVGSGGFEASADGSGPHPDCHGGTGSTLRKRIVPTGPRCNRRHTHHRGERHHG
jgi:hypothetical protein